MTPDPTFTSEALYLLGVEGRLQRAQKDIRRLAYLVGAALALAGLALVRGWWR